MAKEDYVSFEAAKLLKEKGFDITLCNTCYKYNGKFCNNRKSMSGVDNMICYPAPTIQMAMKWLREVHRIDIEVRTHYLNYLKPNDVRYYSGKILKGSEGVIHTIYSKDTYEEVCEAAIKYCIENLI